MNSKQFGEFVMTVLSERKGKKNAMSPLQINDEFYRRTKDRMEDTTARQTMTKLNQEKLVKRHQPGHSKSTFYYWID